MTVRDYEISAAADADISDIYDYTLANFGANQAVSYIGNLEPVLLLLAQHPESGRKRPEIRTGLYSFRYQSHVIFYRLLSNRIRVVRVLHQSRDMPNHL